MGNTFDQDDVFPIIARLIHACHRQHEDFVTHTTLTQAFLADPVGQRAVEAAIARQQEQQSPEWTAGNMIAWFSQRITAEQSEFQELFERTRLDDGWGYRPRK